MIDEKTLTLYYLQDGLSEAERKDVTAALQSDQLLAARYESLAAALDEMRDPQLSEAPDHLHHQWHASIEREAQLERQRAEPAAKRSGANGMGWLGRGAVFASILALGVAIGVMLQQPGPGEPPALVETTPPAGVTIHTEPQQQLAAFERGLSVYLAESSSEISELDQRSNDERTALLAQIISQNRLFERAAVKQQAPEIARLMRAIEPLLIKLASAEGNQQEIERLRRQLGFELNAMLTKLQQPASEKTTTT